VVTRRRYTISRKGPLLYKASFVLDGAATSRTFRTRRAARRWLRKNGVRLV
jgi:hypothetical protein